VITEEVTKMASGISIHLGLNHVDPAQYEGWDGALGACEADARDMCALARSRGFTPAAFLLSREATAAALSKALQDAARQLVKGDILFLSYSGHGGQVEDTNGDEPDRMDETWVLYDRQFLDDELYAMWGRFKAGVRVLVLSDSCHSGTILRDIPSPVEGGARRRAMPTQVARQVQEAHATTYRDIQAANRPGRTVDVRATVLLVSGCMDDQYSMDGPRNGAFTGALERAWADGRFAGDYRAFRDRIASLMDRSQTPNYFVVGAPNPGFERQKPFTI
jgi:metacaspase-1